MCSEIFLSFEHMEEKRTQEQSLITDVPHSLWSDDEYRFIGLSNPASIVSIIHIRRFSSEYTTLMANKQYLIMLTVLLLMVVLAMGRSFYADDFDREMAANKRQFLLRRLYDLLANKRLRYSSPRTWDFQGISMLTTFYRSAIWEPCGICIHHACHRHPSNRLLLEILSHESICEGIVDLQCSIMTLSLSIIIHSCTYRNATAHMWWTLINTVQKRDRCSSMHDRARLCMGGKEYMAWPPSHHS